MQYQKRLPGYKQYINFIESNVEIGERFNAINSGLCIYNQTEESAEILIYDEISPFGVNAKDVALQIQDLKGKLLTVRMNTPGGDVFDGIAIHSLLKSHIGGVNIVVDGIAASAGSLIAMAGDSIKMAQGAFMHVHNPWGVVVGDANDFREFAEKLDKVQGVSKKIYAQRTGLSQKSVQALMDQNEIMTSDEAIEMGFADGLVDTPTTKACITANDIEAKSIAFKEEEEVERVDINKKRRQLELAMVR